MKKILVVEDEEITAIALEAILVKYGYEVTDCVNNSQDAHLSIKMNKPDLILCDIMIKGVISGSELARDIYIKHSIASVFLTAICNDETIEYAKEANALGYIVKPYDEMELKATVQIAFNNISRSNNYNETVEFSKYVYDKRYDKFYEGVNELALSEKTAILLRCLLKDKGAVVSYETLFFNIYSKDEVASLDKLRHLVKRTKEKLDLDKIVSIKNIGYQFNR